MLGVKTHLFGGPDRGLSRRDHGVGDAKLFRLCLRADGRVRHRQHERCAQERNEDSKKKTAHDESPLGANFDGAHKRGPIAYGGQYPKLSPISMA